MTWTHLVQKISHTGTYVVIIFIAWFPVVGQIQDTVNPKKIRSPKHSRFGNFWIFRPFNLAIVMEICQPSSTYSANPQRSSFSAVTGPVETHAFSTWN
jgi:hypothetical protein